MLKPTAQPSRSTTPPAAMTYAQWRAALDGVVLPAACIDLDALDANIDALLAALGDRPVTLRVATKSVRHVGLLRRILARCGPRAHGLMTFAAAEAAQLADAGFDHLLMGYPVGRRPDADILAGLTQRGVDVTAMVDSADHCALLDAAARDASTTLAVCLDLDASLHALGGRVHLGVRRSPLRTPRDVLAVARAVRASPHLRLQGLMAYEAQIAGLRTHDPHSPALDPARRWIHAASKPAVLKRRRAVVEALRAEGFDVPLVNGGGTGSLRFTAQDPSVTEVTAGSGFVCGHLFDGLDHGASDGVALRPAAFFALPVVRVPARDIVTCAGGGYVASGAVGPDRLPIVHLPDGLEPLGMEGFGEVQTPLRVRGAARLALGDPVVCRHAKAGELAERFATYTLLRGGARVADEPTYRGEGWTFM